MRWAKSTVPDIIFAQDGKATLPSKYHGEVTISKVKWGVICSEPERNYYRFNGDKIATTVVNPDLVRCHRHEAHQFLYYKRFNKIMIYEGVEVGHAHGVWFAVVIDSNTSRICTAYPVIEPKPGKLFKPITGK